MKEWSGLIHNLGYDAADKSLYPSAELWIDHMANTYPYASSYAMLKAIYAVKHNLPTADKLIQKAALIAPNRANFKALLLQLVMELKIESTISLITNSTAEEPSLAQAEVEDAMGLNSTQELNIEVETPSLDFEQTELNVKEEEAELRSQLEALINNALATEFYQIPEKIQEEAAPPTKLQSTESGKKSFSSWLQTLADKEKALSGPNKSASIPNNVPTDKQTKGAQTQKPNKDVIQEFLTFQKSENKSPKIPQADAIDLENIKQSVNEQETFITETLANLYAKQGNLKKAKQAYELLMQKHPEKSTYFAALLKNLNQS